MKTNTDRIDKRQLKKELARLTKQVTKLNTKDAVGVGIGDHIATQMMQEWPNDTHMWSVILASICSRIEKDTECRKLLIEWFHERFAAFITQGLLNDIASVNGLLRSLQYTSRDKFDEGNDGEDWSWIEKDNVFVMECQNTRIAVITEKEPFFRLHVRRLRYEWDTLSTRKYYGFPSIPEMRKAKWKVKYGDCRDPGYVVSYGGFISRDNDKVDGAVFYWDRLEHFIWRLKVLHRALREAQTSRLGQLHKDGKI